MRRLANFASNNSIVVDVLGLIIASIVVHSVYMFWIDPSAIQLLFEAKELGEPPPRALAVILKDPEQEICIILSLWCLWLWVLRYQIFMDEAYLLKDDFLGLQDVTSFNATTLHELRQQVAAHLQAEPHLRLLSPVEAALNTLEAHGPATQFKEAGDLGTASCDMHLEQLDAKLNLNKYILWAIPSLGFLGTVRGIGEALVRADEALAGDITGVASSLGVAFNSTFCALFLSLILMAVSYVFQGSEEKLVGDFKEFIATDLIGKLSQLSRARDSTALPPPSYES